MKKFKYKVSVIVPVYNVSEYLEECLDSLLAQTMNKEEMEILLINDGSTDNSFDICKQYAERDSVFKLFTKENEGLSATRNFGIKHAQGRYMMYIDSDDKFTPETVKEVTSFFDKHYEEVDLVTYLDQPYKFGEKMKPHYRYKYLPKSGVYDLNAYPYISQTRVNICVKNMEENFYFDTTPGFRLEDQEYCSKVLKRTQKIGYCDKGEYQYNRSNDGSIVSNYFYAYYIFESSLAYFERLFDEFEDIVPKYYQAMFMNDLQWKHNDNKLYPYHYSNEDFDKAMTRIKNMLKRVDVDTIYNHPKLDNFNKHYWLNLKPNANPIVVGEDDGVAIYVNGMRIYNRPIFELIMHKIRVNGDDLKFMAFVKTPIYTYLPDKPRVVVVENEEYEQARLVDTFESVHSYYKSETKTCNFYAFYYHCDVSKIKNFKFLINFDGIDYDTSYWCMPVAVFNNTIKSYVRGNVKLTLNDNVVEIEKISDEEIEQFESEQNNLYESERAVYGLRRDAMEHRKNHRVWLYYDLYTVEKDNGYYQFINDFKYDDGVERYYVYDREYTQIEHLFTKEQKKYLVKYGSFMHKMLYVSSEKILTAFYGFSTVSPFENEAEEGKYRDIIRNQIIYLQHGVLHANLKTRNHAERCRADKIVVSSEFEKNNYMKNYGYEEEDLICTTMARYDYIDRSKKPGNKILFAPSWRQYLTVVQSGAKWDLLESKLLKSDYYKKFMEFLSSKELHDLLEKNDLYLDVKLHPIIKDAKNLFNIDCDRIKLAPETVELEEYKIFITDFSSFVFDFVYLERALFYFVPDMDQFKSGMNHYRELDLPFEDAFGNLVLEAGDAVKELERIINNNCEPEKIYKDRMEKFFFEEKESYADELYKYLTK